MAMSESARYIKYVREAIVRVGRPSVAHPWSFVIYVDEVTCGNALASHKSARRAVQGVYWALWQLGERALSDDSCWFELVAFQTETTDTFVGRVSHMLDVCLSVFFDLDRHNLRHGCLFTLLGFGRFMLCAIVEMLLADINAIVESIGAMGQNGVVPCFFCRNIISFAAKARPMLSGNNNFVDLTCRDRRRWNMHTSASLLKLLTDLRDAPPRIARGHQEIKGEANPQWLQAHCGQLPLEPEHDRPAIAINLLRLDAYSLPNWLLGPCSRSNSNPGHNGAHIQRV